MNKKTFKTNKKEQLEDDNIVITCADCSNTKRELFQKTNYIDTLKIAQRNIDLERIDGIPRTHYFVKVPFQILEELYNSEIDRYFYINKYYEDSKAPTEHMWVEIGDVNFSEKTICGILANSPIVFDIPIDSIVIVDFKDIEAFYPNS